MGTYFPIFVNMEGKNIRVFGGGKIAARRVHTLLDFGANVQVTAPKITKKLEDLARRQGKQKEPEDFACQGKLVLDYRIYQPGELAKEDFVLAATDDAQVNEAIFRECCQKQIPVNVSSDKEKCDFYFPAIVQEQDITIGIASGGRDHRKVAEMAKRIREWLLCR